MKKYFCMQKPRVSRTILCGTHTDRITNLNFRCMGDSRQLTIYTLLWYIRSFVIVKLLKLCDLRSFIIVEAFWVCPLPTRTRLPSESKIAQQQARTRLPSSKVTNGESCQLKWLSSEFEDGGLFSKKNPCNYVKKSCISDGNKKKSTSVRCQHSKKVLS